MKSILQNKKRCFITGRTDNLEKHHIYFGNPNRKISDCNGFWVYLTAEWHRGPKGPHQRKEISLMLKEACQTAYER